MTVYRSSFPFRAPQVFTSPCRAFLSEYTFKKYILGETDGQPKTPEWAEEESGVKARVGEIPDGIAVQSFFPLQDPILFPGARTYCRRAGARGGFGSAGERKKTFFGPIEGKPEKS